MSFHFQPRMKVVRSARVTSGRGRRTTIGIPETGLSYTSLQPTRDPQRGGEWPLMAVMATLIVLFIWALV